MSEQQKKVFTQFYLEDLYDLFTEELQEIINDKNQTEFQQGQVSVYKMVLDSLKTRIDLLNDEDS